MGEAGSEYIWRTLGTGGYMHASVGDDIEDPGVARHLMDAHLYTRMHRSNQNVYLVALYQTGRVLDSFGRVRFIIDLEELDLAPTQLVTVLSQRQPEAVFNSDAWLGKGTREWQHQTHTQFAALCLRPSG